MSLIITLNFFYLFEFYKNQTNKIFMCKLGKCLNVIRFTDKDFNHPGYKYGSCICSLYGPSMFVYPPLFLILGESRLSVPRFVPFADEIILEEKFYDQQLFVRIN